MNKIVIGDSITAWNPRKDTVNYGVPGDCTRDILWRMEEIKVGKDDKVILMMGINDILMNILDTKIIENYTKILESLITKSKSVVVFSILPIVGEKIRNERIVSLNEKIESLCAEKEVEFVELSSEFTGENGWLKSEFTTDGIHLSTAGYKVLNRMIDTSKQ